MIILPDIHGRNFWKKAVKGHEDEDIIFLGDYLDPYMDEFPMDEKYEVYKRSLDNFKEILSFKRTHPYNVVLLLGNHDCTYMYNTNVCCCRCDKIHYKEIRQLFHDNEDCFLMAYHKRINGTDYLFSHAGVIKSWYQKHHPKHSLKSNCIATQLNKEYHHSIMSEENNYSYSLQIGEVSYWRGGWDSVSSHIWADVREFVDYTDDKIDAYQIFGHTRSLAPIICDKFAMLDAQCGFILTNEGKITKLNGDEIKLMTIEKEWDEW